MTIRNGQSATDHIDPGETLAVTPGAGASVALRQRNSDGSTTFITTVVGATYSIGPFTTTREYVMECAGGTAEYSIFVAPASQGSGSGAPYLGPQTWATLQGGSVADGTPGLLALAKDTVVYTTDRLAPYVPNAAGTAWTVGSAGEVHSVADLAARQTAGDPVPINTLVIDPTSNLIYGQSDGAGGYAVVGGDVVGSVGTGTVGAPALVVSTGFSNAVAAAMEALSAALPKNGQYTDPRVAEQGVIDIGNGAWTLEKTLVLDLSGASTSRFGLTIRGQGRASTILKTASTASPAAFKGGDGIWRLASFINGSAANNIHLRIEGISFVSYATQGGDGSTPLSDPARWVDLKSCLLPALRDLRVYHRYPSALSLDQYGLSLDSCYYASVTDVLSGCFNASGTKSNIAGTQKPRKGGVAFRFVNNNALTGSSLWALGCNLGFHLIDEDGLTLHGGAAEDANKGFLFDGDSSGCRVFGFRHEFNLANTAMESAEEMYFARFAEKTANNYVEQFLPPMAAGGASQDYSASRSNVVNVPRLVARRSTANLLTGVSWTNGSGMSHVAGSDWPADLDATITSSIRLTSTGGYNQTRYSAPVAVNPDLGSVLFRVFVKRISGAGFLSARLQSVVPGTNAPIYKSMPQDPTGTMSGSNATIPVASGSWSGGKLTMTCAREHGIQAGMRVQNTGAWGSLTASTNMYVESTPDASTVVLIASAAGTIPDTGTITFPASITLTQDMVVWSFVPDITAAWQEFASNVSIRSVVASAPSLDGSNKAVIPFGSNVLGLQTGSKIRLSGFADARLNGLAYTVQSGDIVGSNLTLTAAAAMAGLVTTATSKGLVNTSYGYIGLTELVAEVRCVTLNTGQNIVWDIAGESLTPGYSDVLVR